MKERKERKEEKKDRSKKVWIKIVQDFHFVIQSKLYTTTWYYGPLCISDNKKLIREQFKC